MQVRTPSAQEVSGPSTRSVLNECTHFRHPISLQGQRTPSKRAADPRSSDRRSATLVALRTANMLAWVRPCPCPSVQAHLMLASWGPNGAWRMARVRQELQPVHLAQHSLRSAQTPRTAKASLSKSCGYDLGAIFLLPWAGTCARRSYLTTENPEEYPELDRAPS